MTHINPGTDTTINPVVIDDSYRERKQKTPYAKDLKAIEDYIYSTMNHTPEWEKAEQAYQNILSSHTPAQPTEAQQRVDAAIKELEIAKNSIATDWHLLLKVRLMQQSRSCRQEIQNESD